MQLMNGQFEKESLWAEYQLDSRSPDEMNLGVTLYQLERAKRELVERLVETVVGNGISKDPADYMIHILPGDKPMTIILQAVQDLRAGSSVEM